MWMQPCHYEAERGPPRYQEARATYLLAHSSSWETYMKAVEAQPSHSNYTNCAGRTALMYAAHDGRDDVVRLLLSLPDFVVADTEDRNGRTAMHVAVLKGHLCVVRDLVYSPSFTRVHSRCKGGCSARDLVHHRHTKPKRDALCALLDTPRSPRYLAHDLDCCSSRESASLRAHGLAYLAFGIRAFQNLPALRACNIAMARYFYE